jgi:hypothetical protein
MLLRGEDFAGYKLVEGRSTRAWLNEDTAAQVLLKSGLEPDTLYTKKLISPAQAEKVLKKDKGILSELISKSDGKPTLVPSCDKRTSLKDDVNMFDILE